MDYGGKNAKSYNGHEYQSTKRSVNSYATDDPIRRGNVNNLTIDNRKANILNSPYDPTNPSHGTYISELMSSTHMYAYTDTIALWREKVPPDAKDDEAYSIIRVPKINGARVSSFDFGITLRPDTKITTTKQVAEVKLSLGVNRILTHAKISYDAAGNPTKVEYSEESAYPVVQATPSGINLQIAEDLWQGAQLEITYNIIVKNESGAAVTVTKILDYVDEGVTFSTTNNDANWKVLTETEKQAMLEKNKLLYTGTVLCYTRDFPLNANGGTATVQVTTVGTQISPELDEIIYSNKAEIGEYKITTTKVDKGEIPGNYEGHDSSVALDVEIYGPTGKQTIIYYIFGLIMLTILTGGIILIRKVVLVPVKKD